MSNVVKRALIASLILLGTLVVLATYLPSNRPQQQISVAPVLGEVQIGGPFTLVNSEREAVSEDILLGRYSLIYFGFTYCPDICPIALQNITEVIEALGSAGDSIAPVFITVDPERDSPEVMGDYISHFHPRFVGLTGTIEQTQQAAEQYKVYAKKSFLTDADGNTTDDYLVDHTGFTYLVGPDGRYADHFSKDATVQEMVARIENRMSAP